MDIRLEARELLIELTRKLQICRADRLVKRSPGDEQRMPAYTA